MKKSPAVTTNHRLHGADTLAFQSFTPVLILVGRRFRQFLDRQGKQTCNSFSRVATDLLNFYFPHLEQTVLCVAQFLLLHAMKNGKGYPLRAYHYLTQKQQIKD